MPTEKPRVQVTLDYEVHEVIKRMAELQSMSRGAVISDLLSSVTPALSKTVALLDAAKDAPENVKRGLISAAEAAHEDITRLTEEADGQLDYLDELLFVESSPGLPSRPLSSNTGVRSTVNKKSKKAKRLKKQ